MQWILEDPKQLSSPLKIQMHYVLLEVHLILSAVDVFRYYFEIRRPVMICVLSFNDYIIL